MLFLRAGKCLFSPLHDASSLRRSPVSEPSLVASYFRFRIGIGGVWLGPTWSLDVGATPARHVGTGQRGDLLRHREAVLAGERSARPGC